MQYRQHGLHHTILVQEVATAPGFAVPVLYLRQKDGQIAAHVQLHEYFLAHRNMSLQWRRTTARSLGLFWDFVVQAETEAQNWSPTNIHRALFRLWCEALQFGTINPKTKLDHLNLYWLSTSTRQAKNYVESLTSFLQWIYNNSQGTGNEFASSTLVTVADNTLLNFPTNPKAATRFLIVACAMKNISLMHHLKDIQQDARRFEQIKSQELYCFGDSMGTSPFSKESYKFTDPEIVASMMRVGFIKKPKATVPEEFEDITAKMIFLLQAFGGCRISEPYHLWFNDVVPEGRFSCKVFLRHPANADTHFIGQKMSRREYLACVGLLPRNEDDTSGSYHAGWKHLDVDKSFTAPVFWLHPGAEALFATLYTRYLAYRECLMQERRKRGLPDHPFLFVSNGEDRNAGISKIGEPYSMTAFNKAWDKALRRVSKDLGIEILKKKDDGTTPHGLRHFFGQVLSRSSQHPQVIRKSLRHRTVLSQGPYTAADFKRVNNALTVARDKVQNGDVSDFDLSGINSCLGGSDNVW
ncbi:hypothetical protein KOM00_00010 [Geomonas sp. Red69]|uniref:hypothetical protein n=1 Tax=Geomonas diazotrophica TaxID=2843197 RepID=UPI001C110081|nr:hypothetical protein [Geomonas diazotrophica]MBU5635113.1 hypothetical protein [Geomonas diazotrophica]